MEQELKAEEKKLKTLHDVLLEEGLEEEPEEGAEEPPRNERRPGAIQLRADMELIGRIDTDLCHLEVFANGYAIYDNGDRKTVLWVPDCGSYTYNFGQLREDERKYMKQK